MALPVVNEIVTLELEDGKAIRGERIFCEEGQLTLDSGEVIRDIHPYGWLSFHQVLEKSSNVGIIKLARRLLAALGDAS